MKLSELICDLPVESVRGSDDLCIHRIVEDSRLAEEGCLFVARAGLKSDGRMFIGDAIEAGAVAVLCNDAEAVPPGVSPGVSPGVAVIVANDVPLIAAMLAERFHHHPSRRLRLVGITGTNGKTTTAHLIHHILKAADSPCGLIGTVCIDNGRETHQGDLTTPPAFEISRLLSDMCENKCATCVLEASSHALHQRRTAGLDFHIGVFTNLSGDHMDYHGTSQAYLDAKAILFESLPEDGWAVVNLDDPVSQEIISRSRSRILTCGIDAQKADCHAHIGRQTIDGLEATMTGPWGSIEIRLPLVGRHNVMNALQAFVVAHLLGIDASVIQQSLIQCSPPPGRLEPVGCGEIEYRVFVDYAHTDDALDNVLGALKPLVPAGGVLRVVFGCGGDRDRTKRPRMARIACRWADEVIITSDNPRTESPEAILKDILAGVPDDRDESAYCLVDRQKAIEFAIERSRAGDVILIAGKGHEDYQIIGSTRRPFDDRIIAGKAIAHRLAGVGAS